MQKKTKNNIIFAYNNDSGTKNKYLVGWEGGPHNATGQEYFAF